MNRQELIEELKRSEDKGGIKISPREILSIFNYERRTKYNVIQVKRFFKEHEIITEPDFLNVYMDSQVQLKMKPKMPKGKKEEIEEIEAIDYDPVSRVQLLPSANRKPVSVRKESTLQEATTLMLLFDYSQLPVMSSERNIDGIITWETIGNNLIHGGSKTLVKDFMKKDCTVIPEDMTLFEAVKIIIEKEVVIVKNKENILCGLVTATDISEQFITLSEPFLVLEQIENHIRKLLDGKFSNDKLQKFCKEDDSSRKIESISNLNFGEYIRLMENPDNWKEMNLNIDRSTFIKRLDEIRRIRNDVMHFHPDGISVKDFETLRLTSAFFENLSKYRK